MEAIRNEQVSAVFSVGDLLVAKGERCACDVALDVLGRLTELYPVYAVNGNHEVRMRNVPQFREQFLEYDRRVRALGVTMIDNLRVPAWRSTTAITGKTSGKGSASSLRREENLRGSIS